ncbi:hypothetical protein EVAR_31014_1 [Eumeta japonica]|uniref:Mos1 transposase HTH domain-containing protein n=1 Tax=Eumeta variegata TaxID=151549 RepID=A0A4C1VDW9_EUMVA|nr:hypothetical protein EVAR_31014_1 [Eumeta japonica]
MRKRLCDSLLNRFDGAIYYAQQSLPRLRTAFGDEAPCKTTIYNWFTELKRGRVNLNFVTVAVRRCEQQNNTAVRRMIETDTHVTYHEIWASLGIGNEANATLYLNDDQKKIILEGAMEAMKRMNKENLLDITVSSEMMYVGGDVVAKCYVNSNMR